MHRTARLCLVCPLLAVGCYQYVPAPSPEPGRLVRAQLNDAGAAAVTSRLGPGVLELDGLLLANEGEELSLLVETYVSRLQGTLAGGNEPVRLPLGHTVQVLERRIDPVRSAIFGAVVVGSAFALVKVFGPGGLVFEEDDTPPHGPTELVVPVRLGGRAP